MMLIYGFMFRRIVEKFSSVPAILGRVGNGLAGYAIGGIATFWLAERLSGF